ncbi:MAG: Lrp/AsnC family transcriptional regulator [Proteobacteria bacterium]|nr:Lrp/AsnC family transcriptional regulator [Pseudomonadota bacterium]
MSAHRSRRRAPKTASGKGFDSRTNLLILKTLEEDARTTLSALAQRIGISKTPTWARVKALQDGGAITGYHAEVSPAAVGLNLNAFIHVTIRSTQHVEFERAVVGHHAVLECHTTAGDSDYLLHVLVPDVAALDSLLRLEISRMPGVERISTTVALKTIKWRGGVMRCLKVT